MSIAVSPGLYAFGGNPLIVRTTPQPTLKSVVINMTANNKNVGSFSFVPDGNGVVEFDASDILSEFVTPAPVSVQDSIVYPLSSVFTTYTIEVTSHCQSSTIVDNVGGKLFAGGISKDALRELKDKSLDFFSYRLNNHVRQFLFTTRTNGRNITLRERELHPFVFIHPGANIAFVSDKGRMIIPPTQQAGTVCALNIEKLRRSVYDSYKELPSYFSVLVDNSYIFDITLQASPASEAVVLLFRNSLGAYEKIELCGKQTAKGEASESLQQERYNPTYGLPDVLQKRRSLQTTTTVNSGYKTDEEIAFVSDMIRSESVYLVRGNKLIPVIVSVEQWQYDEGDTPLSVSLSIRAADTETHHTATLDYAAPVADVGEWILEDGYINKYGFIYATRTL